MKWLLQDDDMIMYFTYNEWKICCCWEIYQNFEEQSLQIYDFNIKMNDIVNEYSKTYHRTIKIKPVDVTFGNCIEYNVNSNDSGIHRILELN